MSILFEDYYKTIFIIILFMFANNLYLIYNNKYKLLSYSILIHSALIIFFAKNVIYEEKVIDINDFIEIYDNSEKTKVTHNKQKVKSNLIGGNNIAPIINNNKIVPPIDTPNKKPKTKSESEIRKHIYKKYQDKNNSNIEKKYLLSLINELKSHNIISDDDVKHIYYKLELKIINIHEMINSLEKLRDKIINYNIDNRLPNDFYKPIGEKISNDWSKSNYNILNTDKWKVPMKQPPVCINNNQCNVYPNEYLNYTNLNRWDEKVFY